MSPVIWLVVGPPRHGVRLHAQRVAELAQSGDPDRHTLIDCPDVRLERPELTGGTVVVHVTDRLFGTNAREAADTVPDLLADAGASVVVLHDLPQVSDGRNHADRAAAYARIAGAADTVVVGSRYEAHLLEAAGGTPRRVEVVPLPVPTPPRPIPRPTPSSGRPVVATLGFLYPGKGDDDVIAAAADCDPPPDVVNLGGVAAGHADLPGRYEAQARRLGVSWRATGWLEESDLHAAMSAANVPVAAHRHISASGSINEWIGLGRRPIVRRLAYTEELAERLPGCVLLTDDVRSAVAAALRDPDSTWRPPTAIGPTWADVAAQLTAVAAAAGR